MIINRYLTRELSVTLLSVMTILILALLSQQIVRYLNYVAIGKIPTNVLVELVSFEIPYLLAILLPLGLYLGAVLTFGRLYADNEMLILQMSGFGNRRITRLMLTMSVIVGLLVLSLMLWVNPAISAKRQQIMESDAAMVHLIQTLLPGRFQATPDGRHVIFVEALSRDHQRAQNVFIAEQKQTSNDKGKNWALILANQGFQHTDKETNDPFFVMTEGYRYEGMPGENDFTLMQFGRYAIRLPQNNANRLRVENETLSTKRLWQEYQDPKRAAEFQWRFSIALSTVLLALLAMPFSRIKPKQGRYLVLIPAILVYIAYVQLLVIARHWVEAAVVPAWLGMWWVHVMVGVVVWLLLFLQSKQWVGRQK